jgi:GNAT superfamily N-acetyltransferase
MWRNVLADEDAREGGRSVKIAVAGDSVLGFVAAGPSREDDAQARTGEVYAIYARPHHWCSGVGRARLESELAELVGVGFDDVILWVIGDHARACRFYERAGRTRDGRSKTERLFALPDFDAEVDEVCYRREPP